MARTNLNALCDAVVAKFGGIEAYAEIFSRDAKASMDMSQQPLATTKEMRISLEAHRMVLNLNKEADKGNRDDQRLAMEAEEARDVIMADIKDQIMNNPELRHMLMDFIQKAEAQAPKLIEVQSEADG